MSLLAVPNVSEGRSQATIDAIGDAWGLEVLDVHSDADHHRTVFTLTGEDLGEGLARGARETLARIDLQRHHGVHPNVGALDVAPVVYTSAEDRGPACAQALVAADLIARESAIPVFLYGALAGGRTRADLRSGGPLRLAERVDGGELRPDFGPARLHPTGGAVLVCARPPLVAFNLELASGVSLAAAKATARAIRRELPLVRALGLPLSDGVQLSFNVEDPVGTPLRVLIAAVRRHVPVVRGELVGLAPAAAWAGFPDDLPVPGFDPDRHLVERAVGQRHTEEDMAQTRRKRKTKHRGTAAGTVVARGRTGRKPTDAEKKGSGAKDQARRSPRYERAPTWKGAFQRAGIVTAVFIVVMLVISRGKNPASIIAILPVVLVVYTAMGYYTDMWMHRRHLKRKAGG